MKSITYSNLEINRICKLTDKVKTEEIFFKICIFGKLLLLLIGLAAFSLIKVSSEEDEAGRDQVKKDHKGKYCYLLWKTGLGLDLTPLNL